MLQSETVKLKLDASIPANNYKIIEIYNKVKKFEWDVKPAFQRKLVWKKQHKINFIETILLNYPFPEIYIAPGKMDPVSLTYCDVVVDGQQRTTTIINYIEGKDIFSQNSTKIKKFSELNESEKLSFLNFEVSIRYLKNANQEQIKSIFQRINSSEYSLNQMEKYNAQYGDSEFMLFAKQIIEEDDELDEGIIEYKIKKENKDKLHNFFVKETNLFNNNDIDRMLALQYVMTLISTMIEKCEYFNRSTKNETYIEKFNGEFTDAYLYEDALIKIISIINNLSLSEDSIWFKKSNMFTLFVELYRFSLDNDPLKLNEIKLDKFSNLLIDFEGRYYKYLSDKENYKEVMAGEILYFEGTRQGVNDLEPRKNRGKIVKIFINESI